MKIEHTCSCYSEDAQAFYAYVPGRVKLIVNHFGDVLVTSVVEAETPKKYQCVWCGAEGVITHPDKV